MKRALYKFECKAFDAQMYAAPGTLIDIHWVVDVGTKSEGSGSTQEPAGNVQARVSSLEKAGYKVIGFQAA